MKSIIVGKRKINNSGGLKNAEGFLELIVKLRGDKPFVKKGVYKFKTFEESQNWMLKQITRNSSQDRLQ